jgi:hypothetical protein
VVTDNKRLALSSLDNDNNDINILIFCILEAVTTVFPAAIRFAVSFFKSYLFYGLLQALMLCGISLAYIRI